MFYIMMICVKIYYRNQTGDTKYKIVVSVAFDAITVMFTIGPMLLNGSQQSKLNLENLEETEADIHLIGRNS